jgi:hypothetical protein
MKTVTASLLALALPALVTARRAGSCHNDHKPLVTSRKLQSHIKLDDLLAGAQKLQDFATANEGSRSFGGGGHNATVDYIYDTLKSLNYYDVYKQPFTEVYMAGEASLKIDGQDIEIAPVAYSPDVDDTKPLVAVSNLGCDAADFPVEVSGNIALISRGECPFGQKALNAKAAGAVAAILYNNEPGLVAGTMGEPLLDYAGAVCISQEQGQALLEKMAVGEVTAQLKVDVTIEPRVSYNVIAETKGGDHNNVLMLGAHSDSVHEAPGIK